MEQRNAGKVALCFPGQLSKVPDELGGEMSSGGEKRFPHPFFEKTWEKVGFDLFSFFFQQEEEDRCLNLKLQVASYLLSMVSFDQYCRKGGQGDFIAEHSMGIYAALAAAEAMTFEEGLEMVKGIGLILERVEGQSPGGLIVIIGLASENIKEICSSVEGDLYVANVNGSRQFVLSGDRKAIERGMEMALEQGAISAQRLTFNTPLHSPLMESIMSDVRQFTSEFTIHPPRTPVVSHWGGGHLSDPDEIRDFLAEELSRPVDWEGCVQYLLSVGVTCFIEMGPHDTLTRLIRWINRDVKALSYGVRDII
jgi:[acyl-carrier-protein] S-malonyltransferase